jgi:hypothetical protein
MIRISKLAAFTTVIHSNQLLTFILELGNGLSGRPFQPKSPSSLVTIPVFVFVLPLPLVFIGLLIRLFHYAFTLVNDRL